MPEPFGWALSRSDLDVGFCLVDNQMVFFARQAKAGPEFIPIPVAQIQGGENLIVWPEESATGEYRPQSWVR